MRVGNVSVQIPEGRERETGYVEMIHEQVYTIRLGNHHYKRRVDAKVELDGKDIGTYRVNDGGFMTLERSSHDDGKFTFMLLDSTEGAQAGIHKVDKDDRGLIKVTFMVERKPVEQHTKSVRGLTRGGSSQSELLHRIQTSASPDAYKGEMGLEATTSIGMAQNRMAAGGTGLTGHSSQQFVEVPNLDYDHKEETVITLRLVGSRHAVRELVATPRANPVPPPVG